ncbi:MAG: DUF2380 domain-containing protein [Myxococcales bacterium]|nr:DUF2380 domain-containing protein [Myxococcales bacterium]
MGPALAAAGGADVARLPLDAELWITARPKVNLDASAARLGDEPEPWLEVESVESVERYFDNYGDDATYVDDPADWQHGNDHGSDAFRDSDDIALDRGIGVLDPRRLGIQGPDRHHVFPQSGEQIDGVTVGGRKWFKDRGIEIDEYCVEISDFDHDMIHGGNQRLASKHWREREWRSAVLDRLAAEEKLQAKVHGDPKYKLSPDEIWAIVNPLRIQFDIADLPFVRYPRSTK